MNNKLLLEYIRRYVDLTPNEINLLLENIAHRKVFIRQHLFHYS